jgi:hypothetical protein
MKMYLFIFRIVPATTCSCKRLLQELLSTSMQHKNYCDENTFGYSTIIGIKYSKMARGVKKLKIVACLLVKSLSIKVWWSGN